jgi:hypothetical protein
LGDSIINAIIWLEARRALNINVVAMKFHGDDAIVAVKTRFMNDNQKERVGRDILKRLSDFVAVRYKMKIDVDKSSVSTELLVGVIQPRVPQYILDGSSAVMNEYRKKMRMSKGRPLTLDEEFVKLEDEPIGPAPGLTHRWAYHFKGRPSFLSYYFKRDQSSIAGGSIMMIRPTQEVLDRLVNVEYHVKTLDDHEMH